MKSEIVDFYQSLWSLVDLTVSSYLPLTEVIFFSCFGAELRVSCFVVLKVLIGLM